LIYEYELNLLSSAIVTRKVGRLGYKSYDNLIPGSVVRGGLLTALYERGYIDLKDLEEEVDNPSLSISSAYFSGDLEEPMLFSNLCIAHAFSRVSKHSIGDYGQPIVSILSGYEKKAISDLGRYVEELEKGFSKLGMELSAKKKQTIFNPLEFKRCTGAVAVKIGNVWFRRNSAHEVSVNIGLHRGRRSVESEMFFYYEAISRDQSFRGFIVDSKGILDNVKELRVGIGRGVSRGFGRAILKLRRISVEDLVKRLNLDNLDLDEGANMFFVCFTPYASFDPEGLLRGRILRDTLTLPTDWMKMYKEFNAEARLKLIGSVGGYGRYGGYSLKTGYPKMVLRTLVSGSVIVYKVDYLDGDTRSIAELFASTLVLGVNELAAYGLSHLLPMSTDYISGPLSLGEVIK